MFTTSVLLSLLPAALGYNLLLPRQTDLPSEECLAIILEVGASAPTPPPELLEFFIENPQDNDNPCDWLEGLPNSLTDEAEDYQSSVLSWASANSDGLAEIQSACPAGEEPAVCTDGIGSQPTSDGDDEDESEDTEDTENTDNEDTDDTEDTEDSEDGGDGSEESAEDEDDAAIRNNVDAVAMGAVVLTGFMGLVALL